MNSKHNLPSDRESLFRFNIREIPETPQGKNVLQIAVQTRIKLFYRPAGLTGTAADAPQQLQWHVVPNPDGAGVALKVSNPTSFHVTFSDITLGSVKENVTLEMVAPKSDAIYPLKDIKTLPGSALPVTFRTINDFGAVTKEVSVEAAL